MFVFHKEVSFLARTSTTIILQSNNIPSHGFSSFSIAIKFRHITVELRPHSYIEDISVKALVKCTKQ